MPRSPKPPKPTAAQLAAILKDPNRYHRIELFSDYGCHAPGPDDLPTLRQALIDPEFPVVRVAATSIGKLGPAAREAEADLFAAARRMDPDWSLPQAYAECVQALVAIGADAEALVHLVAENITHSNWGYVRTSMHALKAIGTPAALDQLAAYARFWWPEFNKTQRAYVQKYFPGAAPAGASSPPPRQDP